jgi:hypothetical protein
MPAFGAVFIKHIFDAMVQTTDVLIKKWDQCMANKEHIDLREDMTKVTVDVSTNNFSEITG